MVGALVGEPAGPVEQLGPLARVVREPDRLRQVALRLAEGRERRGALARADERLVRLSPHLAGVGRLGIRLVRVDVVGGDHLGDLVLVRERRAQVRGRGEVAGTPLVPRQRLVGDVADEVLQEAVLPVLGRARVGLQAEHLLAHERGEQRLELARSRGPRAPRGRRA